MLKTVAGLLSEHGHSIEELISAMQGEMPRGFHAERVAIGFLHSSTMTLVFGPVRSRQPKLVDTGARFALSDSMREQLETGASSLENDFARAKKCPLTEALLKEGWCSSLTVPMIAGSGAVGLLWLCSRRKSAYTKEHELLARLFASHFASLLEKSRWIGKATVNANLRLRLQDENALLRELVHAGNDMPELIGESPLWLKTLQRVRMVANSDATVLIRGETGTGKELIARAVHQLSPRRTRPFVAVNCGVFSSELIASELFGHERGAFTGAVARKFGRIELAHGGTLFLDEVGELSGDVQVKLLRFLQEREFERVGGNTVIKSDVRVIAATHRDLNAARQNGSFRDDLFFRLNVFPIHVPPLRERKEDIEPLTRSFVERYGQKVGKKFTDLDPRSMAQCLYYHWPGNVRELENLVERSMLLCEGPQLRIDPLLETDAVQAPEPSFTLHAVVRAHLLKVLRMTRGRVYGEKGAAKMLGLKPSTLQAKLKKHGIILEDVR